MSKLYTSLLAAKRNITPPFKNKKAVYGRYADLEAILTAVEPPLAEEGLVIVQSVIQDDSSNNYLRTSVVHTETGESVASDVPLVTKDPKDPQKLGGSITYARRYGITALLSIVADDDDDGNTSAGKGKDGAPAKKPAKEQGVTQERIEEVMKGGDLPQKMLNALVKEFERAEFDKSDVVPEAKAVLKRDFGQLSELTEAEARTVVGHVRKVKAGETERLT